MVIRNAAERVGDGLLRVFAGAGSTPAESFANVVRVTYEAVRLIVCSSGGDNEVPKSVVGCLCDVFGIARRWLCGDRSSRDDQVGDTVRVRPVLTCDLSHSEDPS